MRMKSGLLGLIAAAWVCAGNLPGRALAQDVSGLWDFADPAASEARFRAAQLRAVGDDRLILETQIARSYVLRGDFAVARTILLGIEPSLAEAGIELRVRHALEWGRSFSSSAHPDETQTHVSRETARNAYLRAFALARDARLDDLAIDALRMLAYVDSAPLDQIRWTDMALDLMEQSAQHTVRRWEASLRNDRGNALHRLGRYREALDEFRRALAVRERSGRPASIRAARWMVAWTLRYLGRTEEALAIQLALASEAEAAGAPDRDVYQELEYLYRSRHEHARADEYAARRDAL
ncbi:tetratricopeptide repeat protein [Paludibacterium paludis]|uniref:Tetratricopeptide repeat protein n=1 Tax=Paludibacterium paludis TaxID=1225769 RepID=A0A918P6R3_9NEIS|nr:tetratricopeptide repeat protein [Paludibacterium paludis]GGY26669.1 hypothetical protein GCM10011289_32790 [Paludibacterium paludis]